MLSTAQTDYGILFAQQDRDANCPTYNNAFVNRPKEVGFNTVRRGDKLYLRVTDDKWLKNLMRGNLDGIAIDVLASDQYACEATFPKTQIRGVLLKPVYKVVLLKELKADGKNGWLTPIGLLPAALRNKSLEFNILFLSNKTMCQYYNVYNLDSYPWNLLDMGIYLDKVVYSQENISNEKEASKNKYKTLNFTVPFDKNKSEYSAIDVKPIYDSLNLTDYKISKIKINAYASVEGSIAINKKLQEDRGNSIIASLKSYIKDNIATEVRTSENWAEFFRDIQNTPYASLGQLSKEEIKQKLTGATVQKLEPILTKHRKGVVTIELTKIERFKSMSDAELMVTFNKQLQDGDLENALIVQKALFDRAMTQASPDILNKMEVPQQAIYADFNNNKAIFGYFKDARAALIAKNALKKVIEVAPKNKKAHYNIVAIDVFLLRNRVEGINEKDVRVAIQNLKKYGIANALIQRMMVNLNIIKAEQKNREKKYNEKDIAVKYIKDTYTNADLSASNYLSLAQFLTYYDNTESSIRLLQPVVSKVGVNEDLLYYYLNQTIVNEAYVQRDDYRAILNNAYGQNPQRFCNLFNASTEGGITFQLLNNDYLRRSYCENCRE
jgi:hypothetical protein